MYETKDSPSTDGVAPQNILYVTVKMDTPSLLDCEKCAGRTSESIKCSCVDEVVWKTERGARRILSRGLRALVCFALSLTSPP